MKKIEFLPKLNTKDIAILGMLLALSMVTSQVLTFAYPPGQSLIVVSISFVIAMTAILYGPVIGGMFGATVDLIGVAMFGVQGLFHWGFVFSSFMAGFIPGLLIWIIIKKKIKIDFTYITIGLLAIIIPVSIYYTNARVDNGRLEARFLPVLVALLILSIVLITTIALVAKFKIKEERKYPFHLVLATVLPAKMLVSFILNPLWLSQLYGGEIIAYLPLRFIVFPLNTISSIIVLYVVLNRFEPLLNNKVKK